MATAKRPASKAKPAKPAARSKGRPERAPRDGRSEGRPARPGATRARTEGKSTRRARDARPEAAEDKKRGARASSARGVSTSETRGTKTDTGRAKAETRRGKPSAGRREAANPKANKPAPIAAAELDPGTLAELPMPEPKPRAPRKLVAVPDADGVKRSGTVTLLGKPNAGKSTLLNAILGEPLAITSHHPQTTRDQILGVVRHGQGEIAVLDTPGLHRAKNALGARMNAYARDALERADVAIYMVELRKGRYQLGDDDLLNLRMLPAELPVVLVINKIDKLTAKSELFPVLEGFAKARDFAAIVPISATKKDGARQLLDVVVGMLPEVEVAAYDEDTLTDRPARFFVAEYMRERILRHTDKEVPHGVAVAIERWETTKKGTEIAVLVHVDKTSHKPIVLGKGGLRMKAIATEARQRIENLLGGHVFLTVTVRVTPGWYEKESLLEELGYGAS